MLFKVYRGRFAGCANDDDAIGSFTNMEVDQGTQSLKVKAAILEHWSNDCDEAALQHGEFLNKKARILTDSFRRRHFMLRCDITGANALDSRCFRRRHFNVLISNYTQARSSDFEQFTGPQQKIRIRWLAEALVACGKCLIDQCATGCKGADD